MALGTKTNQKSKFQKLGVFLKNEQTNLCIVALPVRAGVTSHDKNDGLVIISFCDRLGLRHLFSTSRCNASPSLTGIKLQNLETGKKILGRA